MPLQEADHISEARKLRIVEGVSMTVEQADCLLKRFDMTSRFGPFMSVTRAEVMMIMITN
jgi:signal recognition particle GTPase